MRRMTRRAATLAATLTMLLVGALGLVSAAPASATTAHLEIYRAGFDTCLDPYTGRRIGDYLAHVYGQVDGYYPFGFQSHVNLWGDDPSYDDHLLGPVTFDGYDDWLCVKASTLNEDWGGDEIYARVIICGPRCLESATSNVVQGNF